MSFHREKNGTEVSQLASLKGRYEVHDKEYNFIIRDTSVEDAGTYICSIPELGASAEIRVVGEWLLYYHSFRCIY